MTADREIVLQRRALQELVQEMKLTRQAIETAGRQISIAIRSLAPKEDQDAIQNDMDFVSMYSQGETSKNS